MDIEPRLLASTTPTGAELAQYFLSFEGTGWDGDLNQLKTDDESQGQHMQV